MIETLARGWLAVSFVQQIGLGARHLADPTTLVQTLTGSESSTVSTILAGHIFVLVCAQTAFVKAALLLSDTRAMHVLHAVVTGAQLAFFAKFTLYSNPSMELLLQILLASVSVFLEGLYLLMTRNVAVEEPAEPRPRRLIAKHYLEAHVSDLNTGARRKHD
uniref:TLC domain-containing protein n=1 Tax=Panagrellus redivivus TaxID=6233 RepID=A0A7E4VR56_PANRE